MSSVLKKDWIGIEAGNVPVNLVEVIMTPANGELDKKAPLVDGDHYSDQPAHVRGWELGAC